jgi:magnesium-transporting ATPase (P-type)
VLFNAAFSFWQEHRAQRAMTALRHLLPAHARVIRSGVEVKIPASEVVVGDLLVLAEGDDIPADARVVEEFGLRTNNATLTGEAMPARKTADPSLRDGLTEVERPNLVFAGTSVVSGTGRALVYETGMTTQFGRIANLTQTVVEPPSPLQQQLTRLTRILAAFAVGVGVTVIAVGAIDLQMDLAEAFVLGIGLIVAFMPEGLRPTVTLTLAMAGQRLANKGVLVKQLSTVEELGATSVICTDKSGTLTQNQMTVREVWVAHHRLKVSGVGYEPRGQFTPAPFQSEFKDDFEVLMNAALLCNNSRLNPPTADRPQWTSLGDQTEAALRVLALKAGLSEQAVAQEYPRIHELPFDAKRKRMSTIHRWAGQEIAFVKGAPREVLQLCTHILIDGEVRELTHAIRAEILAANDDHARRALRVLALAWRELPPRSGAAKYAPESVERDLTFIGLAAMMDPPRPEVAKAIKKFHNAGIRLAMITGDYGLTAESVARRIGLLHTSSPRILTGAELDELDDAQLQDALKEETIFARMAPDHKLRLVAAFQARGETVAVIGDGVNDAPALRKSDIGIAMGITGTDVAKQAADVILTDDNFGAIATAVEEGRAVFDNLRKFTTYIFASNVPEIMPFLLKALFDLPLALTVTQILAIDLGTDLLPALALGTEQPEPSVMQRPPRRKSQPLVDNRLIARALWLGSIETVLCYIGFFLVYHYFDASLADIQGGDTLPFVRRVLTHGGLEYSIATTVFHLGVVAGQIGSAFVCRTEKEQIHRMGFFTNRFLLLGIAAEVVIIWMLINVEPLAQVFEHVPPPLPFWLILIAYPWVVYLLDWFRKLIVRRREKAVYASNT